MGVRDPQEVRKDIHGGSRRDPEKIFLYTQVYYIQFLLHGEVYRLYKENMLMQFYNLKKERSFNKNIDKL